MAELIDDKAITRGIERAFIERTNLLKIKRARVKDEPKEVAAPTEELLHITEDSQEELLRVTAVFPFQPFPDTVAIDREKVSIINRMFFSTAKVISVKITDVLNIESRVGPFFGSIKIYSKYFVDNFHEINFLTRRDAAALHDILQGYMIAIEKEVDCSQIPKEELVMLLKELGHPTDK